MSVTSGAAPSTRRPAPRLRSRWIKLLHRRGPSALLVAADAAAVGIGVLAMPQSWRLMALFGAALLVVLWLGGLHRPRLTLSVLDDAPRIAGRWLAASGIAILADMAWSGVSSDGYLIDWSFVGAVCLVGLLVLVFRTLSYAAVRSLRRSGRPARRTLVVGAGQVGSQIAEVLQDHPEYGLRPIGFLDADPRMTGGDSGLPVLGGPWALAEVLERESVSDVVVAFSAHKESAMVDLIRTSGRHHCELFLVPRFFELHNVGADVEQLWGIPLIRLRRATYRTPGWRAKRAFDVLLSGLVLLLIAPVMAAIALAVRLDGGPGILFRQERVGVDGRSFTVLKFRSMRPASEAESATTWNIAQDDRLGGLGRFLRKSSLDELPQLLNVLSGDMSLVGPRPERPHFVSQFRELYPSYHARHRVPSGLTGWAQIHNLRGDTSISERARFDNYYIENWSLWLDVKIMMRTLSSVVRGSGA
ncbi:sugar transferase [Blastococcus sp. TF02A-26]|uniref:sugar transferase n=1 Tax=Blastococcus sp. TF02A-26 TaxID=2250577 RepID=UPI00131461F8|nr:sugar transferase [Blastococcus sp. TF02A-26]